MTQPQSPLRHSLAPSPDFRKATSGLADLTADAQVRVLEFELFQALKRAADAESRNTHLERQLEEAHAASDVWAEQHYDLSARAMREIASAYERELRILQEAYVAIKQRCKALDECCRSLLLTIEKAACVDDAADLPVLKSAPG